MERQAQEGRTRKRPITFSPDVPKTRNLKANQVSTKATKSLLASLPPPPAFPVPNFSLSDIIGEANNVVQGIGLLVADDGAGRTFLQTTPQHSTSAGVGLQTSHSMPPLYSTPTTSAGLLMFSYFILKILLVCFHSYCKQVTVLLHDILAF